MSPDDVVASLVLPVAFEYAVQAQPIAILVTTTIKTMGADVSQRNPTDSCSGQGRWVCNYCCNF